MRIVRTTTSALMLAWLAGCAGVTTGVETHGALPAPSASAHASAPYRLVRTPAQQAASGIPAYEAMLRDALAARGFTDAGADSPAYQVSVAWATRPADVDVGADDCQQNCLPSSGSVFPWFGQVYLHQLTLRFFALPDGRPVYKVTAVKRDRNADARQALPYLIASVLAQLPRQGGPQWRVKLDDAHRGAGNLPAVVSVAPAGR